MYCSSATGKNKHNYAPAYSKNSGRALSVTPVRPVRLSVRPSVRLSVRSSVRPYVPLSCPGHNSKTLWNIFMKYHRCIQHNKTMCHEQGRQLLQFWFLNYFPLMCMHDIGLMCHKLGRQLWHFLCPRLFDRPYVPL